MQIEHAHLTSYYRGARIALHFVETRRPAGRRFGGEADCWDNAVAESAFGSIKAELFDHVPVDIHDVQHQLFEYIESFYNRHRLHSTLDYVTPHEKLQLLASTQAA